MVEKRLLGFADVSTERIALFREAALQKAVNGPGVVSIVDEHIPSLHSLEDLKNYESELCSIYREYIDGYSLQDLIRSPDLFESSKSCPERLHDDKHRCAHWIRSLLLTLERVHDFRGAHGRLLGLVHRDVTPGNVLIEKNALRCPPGQARVWLNDFGLARVAAWGPLAPEETLQGARRYLSPELRDGHSPTAASDVYQAALILCVLFGILERIPLPALFRSEKNSLEGLTPSEEASRLLAPWKAGAALDPHPGNRPSALELAILLST